jgi:predicted transposase/invertase (TIGR01784 family)
MKHKKKNQTTESGEVIVSPHDKVVKVYLSEKETAKSLFEEYLPAKITKNLDFNTLKISKDTFVDKKMSDYFSDILYQINLLNIPIFIYFLIEHKSREERLTSFQVLKYMVGIWKLYLKQNEEAKTLPVIIPIIIYHGPQKWKIDTNFISLFNAPDYLKEYIPDFNYNLQDISSIPDKEIKGAVLLRILFKTLKYIFTPELRYKLREILELFLELKDKKKGTEYLEVLLRYLTRSARDLTEKELKETVTLVFEERGGDIMATIAEKWIEEGVKIGVEKGEQKGEKKGIKKEKLETARRMINDDFPIETIIKYTELTEEEIKGLMN